jgi:hypothetical protein
MLDTKKYNDQIVTCDQCGHRFHTYTDVDQVCTIANESGWQCSTDRDLCRSCKPVEVS